jgi:hypothetical protein
VTDGAEVPDGSDVTLKSRFFRYVASRSFPARAEEELARLVGVRFVSVRLVGGRAMATPF